MSPLIDLYAVKHDLGTAGPDFDAVFLPLHFPIFLQQTVKLLWPRVQMVTVQINAQVKKVLFFKVMLHALVSHTCPHTFNCNYTPNLLSV